VIYGLKLLSIERARTDEYCRIPSSFLLTPIGCGVRSLMDRDQVSHTSRARAGRSRQCQSKWADSTR